MGNIGLVSHLFGIVLGMVFLAIGGVMLARTIRAARKYRETGVVTAGVVVAFRYGGGGFDGPSDAHYPAAFPLVRFSDGSGVEREFWNAEASSDVQRVGQRVSVWYDGDQEPVIVQTGLSRWLALVFIVLGVVFVVVNAVSLM